MDTQLLNLASIPTREDATTKYFNNFYIPSSSSGYVDSNQYDAVVSYFENRTSSLASAKLLAQAVIDTAAAQREDVMQVLELFKSMDNGEIDTILALYLNSARVNTSFLGVKNAPKPNQFVKRSILT